jgi:hypothetical protein
LSVRWPRRRSPVGSENSSTPLNRTFPWMVGPATVRPHHGKARTPRSRALVVRLPRRPSSPLPRPERPAHERVQGDRDPGAAPRARDPAPQPAAALPPTSRSVLARNAEPVLGARAAGRRSAYDPRPSFAGTVASSSDTGRILTACLGDRPSEWSS